jgi:hypothetical protein
VACSRLGEVGDEFVLDNLQQVQHICPFHLTTDQMSQAMNVVFILYKSCQVRDFSSFVICLTKFILFEDFSSFVICLTKFILFETFNYMCKLICLTSILLCYLEYLWKRIFLLPKFKPVTGRIICLSLQTPHGCSF